MLPTELYVVPYHSSNLDIKNTKNSQVLVFGFNFFLY